MTSRVVTNCVILSPSLGKLLYFSHLRGLVVYMPLAVFKNQVSTLATGYLLAVRPEACCPIMYPDASPKDHIPVL